MRVARIVPYDKRLVVIEWDGLKQAHYKKS